MTRWPAFLAAAWLSLAAVLPARAQDAPQPPAPPVEETRVARQPGDLLRADRDRFELGAAIASGPFEALGTFAYRRVLRVDRRFEHWVHLELAGGTAAQLDEGAVSLAYLVRPVGLIRRDWPIQPILEFGPAGHVVVQVANLRGFDETAFHSRAYLKTHAYAGFDVPLGSRFGVVARGRLTVPAHHPFDYAQIALFLR